MQTNCKKFFPIACRAAAFSFLMAGSAMLMQAQQTPSVAPAVKAPVFLAALAAPDYAASSSAARPAAVRRPRTLSPPKTALVQPPPQASQPPPRRRYGQPSYSGGNTNPDGSKSGRGSAASVSPCPSASPTNMRPRAGHSRSGFGRDWSKTFGVIASSTTTTSACRAPPSPTRATSTTTAARRPIAAGSCGVSGLDGNNHVWSFTLNPTFTLPTEGSLGAYAVVGAGFYHKVTNFTVPRQRSTADYYCGCYYVQRKQCRPLHQQRSGVSGGFGLTYKFSKFSNQRFYVEARYVFMVNSQRAGLRSLTLLTANGTPSNPGPTPATTPTRPTATARPTSPSSSASASNRCRIR